MREIVGIYLLGVVVGALITSYLWFLHAPRSDKLQKEFQQEAVDVGAAEWKVTTNGVSYFEWKKN